MAAPWERVTGRTGRARKLCLSQNMNIIECQNLSKTFSGRKETTIALDDVSFSIPVGRIVGLLGPDGAGKTTLMRLLCGLLRPTRGTATVLGFDSVQDAYRIQAEVGYMPQKFGLYENMTVEENLSLYAQLHGVSAEQRTARYPRLLQLTNLTRFSDRMAGKLSGGMKQKLNLVCALVSQPKLLLLDEPTVGVDILARRELWSILQQIAREESTTVLASTAYMDEADFCDQTLVLIEGKLIANQKPDEIKSLAKPYLADSAGSVAVSSDLLPSEKPYSRKTATAGEEFEKGFQVLLSGSVAPPLERKAQFAPNQEALVRAKNLVKTFGSFTAVNNVSFDVRRGEIFGLLGANGAGKTTTFRALCGLSGIDSGEIEICSRKLKANLAFARSQIGYVAQKFSLYGDLSVRQNLEFFGGAYGLRSLRLKQRVNWALESFELTPFAQMDAGKLPLGFKRRLAMGAALLHEPPILFLDEATSGADPMARYDFWRRIINLADSGVAVIITTHFLDEARYCDRMIVMQDGVSIACGSAAEIISQSGGAPNLEEAFVRLIQRENAGVNA